MAPLRQPLHRCVRRYTTRVPDRSRVHVTERQRSERAPWPWMEYRSGMRSRPVLLSLSMLFLLTSCASPDPHPPSPELTPSVISPSPSAPAAVSTPTADDASGSFTDDLLVELCIEKTHESHGGEPQFDRDNALIEEVEGDAPWFVLIPVVTAIGDAISYCTIGGIPDAPTFELHGGATPEMEEEIRSWVTPAEHG